MEVIMKSGRGWWGAVAVSLFLSVVGISEGLECYECLSLNCPSGAVCLSIKKTMQEIFVPKGHIIHFQPQDQCPEWEDPLSPNSTKWAPLSKQCQRSDSVCLVSPIEIISTLDGSKGGKALDPNYQLTTKGYIRGCASRRKLQEHEATIKVTVNLLSKGKHSSSTVNKTAPYFCSPLPCGSENLMQKSQDLEMELDLSRLKFAEDDFQIKKVHSHEFYIDQGTKNATKCLENRCNTKVRYKSGGGGRTGQNLVLLGTMLLFMGLEIM